MISADDFSDDEIEIKHSVHYTYNGFNYKPSDYTNLGTIVSTDWLTGNTTGFVKYGSYSYEPLSYTGTGTTNFIDRFSIKNDSEPLVDVNNKVILTVQGLAGNTEWGRISASASGMLLPYQYYEPFVFNVYGVNQSGHWELLEDASVQYFPSGGRYYDLVIDTGAAPFNLHTIEVDVVWHFEEFYNDSDSDFMSGRYWYNRAAGFIDTQFSWSYYGASDLAAQESLKVEKNILQAILELPTNIVVNIEESLTKLFVPDEQSITSLQEDWNTLMADRFGALYQVSDLVMEFADAFQESEQDTITLPAVTVPVGADGWTFGGWEIQVVPDGMNVLFTTLKTLVSIVATFLFVNGLKRRFEGLIGGAPTA